MANRDHLAVLQRGVKAWNEWRSLYPETIPDLTGADFRGLNEREELNLRGARLQSADLRHARLDEPDFRRADLTFGCVGVGRVVEDHLELLGALDEPVIGIGDRAGPPQLMDICAWSVATSESANGKIGIARSDRAAIMAPPR